MSAQHKHNPKGIAAPIENWTHADVVTWMTWEIVRGITSGERLEGVVFQFPQFVIQWHEAKDKRSAAIAKQKGSTS
jgi:hypothetical protein